MVSGTDQLELRDYQVVMQEWFDGRPRSGAFLDMGLGKTASLLRSLTPERLPALVLAPKRVAENTWPTEGRIWRPDLRVACAEGGPEERKRILRDLGLDVVSLSKNTIGDLMTASSRGPQWKTLVLDESSGFKDHTTTSFKSARAFVKHYDPPFRYLLTGTPSPEGLPDLWSQIYLLDGGERLGKTIGEFRRNYLTPGWTLPNGVVTVWDPLPGAFEIVMEKIQDICISMTAELDIPPVTHNPVYVDLPAEAMRIYRTLKKDKLVEYTDLIGELSKTVVGSTPGVVSAKLEQIAQGVMFDQDRFGRASREFTVIHREKIIAVKEIVEAQSSPVIVLYKYQPELELLKKEFKQYGTMEPKDAVDRWNAGDTPVLLSHPNSLSHGLNMQFGGHTMIWAGLQWSLERWLQTNKRLPRPGQEHPVVIHRVMANKTIDSLIFDRLEGKEGWQQGVLDHLESPL